MEHVLGAITVKTTDISDNDKLITFLTPKGVIAAKAKGIKRADAKLKFCALPFCFSEITLSERGGYYTLIGAQAYDTFFDLTVDYNAFCAGTAALETAVLYDSTTAGRGMIELVNAFKSLLNGRVKESLVKYLLNLLQIIGYGYGLDACAVCGNKVSGSVFFSYESGITCQACQRDCVALSPAAANALRLIADADYLLLSKYRLLDAALNELLLLLKNAVHYKTDLEIKSLKSLFTA